MPEDYTDYEYNDNVDTPVAAEDSAPLPTFTDKPETFAIQEGETVVLPCRSADAGG